MFNVPNPPAMNLQQTRDLRYQVDNLQLRGAVHGLLNIFGSATFSLLTGQLPVMPTIAAAAWFKQTTTVLAGRKYEGVGDEAQEKRNNIVSASNMVFTGRVAAGTQALALAETVYDLSRVTRHLNNHKAPEPATVTGVFAALAAVATVKAVASTIQNHQTLRYVRNIKRNTLGVGK